MATFLELCQNTAAESGTLPAASITDVATASGRPAAVVRWVNRAWQDIQNARNGWRWMQAEYQGTLVIGQARYTGADFSLTRVATFLPHLDRKRTSIYDGTIGASDEGPIAFVPWDQFYGTHLIGGMREAAGKPVRVSVDDAEQLVYWPTPDKAYVTRGFYRKLPQTLSVNDDVPEMPARFHDVIMWGALNLLAKYDEGLNQLAMWQQEYRRLMKDLERDQLPQVMIPETLA